MGLNGSFVKINFTLRYNTCMDKLLAYFKTQKALDTFIYPIKKYY